MQLSFTDWVLVALFPALSLAIGALTSLRAGQNAESYFLSGRNMPWWLLGLSLVATTFSTDTPNLVTDIVRTNGVAGNWAWWAFLPTGMITAFIYAKLWRRSGVMTDLEFYEIRYSSRFAAYLRTFRALYIGVFFNVMVMAAVTLAALKIGAVMLGTDPFVTLLALGLITMIFSTTGGFLGVVVSDMILFFGAMAGAIGAAIYTVNRPEIGGFQALFNHPAVHEKLSILPDFSNHDLALSLFIIPLLIQWWSVWYPGSEPGGGGYVAQRMLAAKNGKHAVGAMLFFQLAHYAIRPWPWILVALASLIVFPDIESLRVAFPNIAPSAIGNDLAYSAMLKDLPHGLLGLVVASLIAAYMSTIATQLNWGASYVVNDFWKRHIHPDAPEKELVHVGKAASVILMIMTGGMALTLSHALEVFNILLTIGAGTGLLFLLRWYWWRINAFSELAAMVSSFSVALFMQFGAPTSWSDSKRLVISVAITTAVWLIVTFITPATDRSTLHAFLRLANPGGPGWRRIRAQAKRDGVDLPAPETGGLALSLACVPVSIIGIYATLFAIGYWLYGNHVMALSLAAVTIAAAAFLALNWSKLFDRQRDDILETPKET